MVLVWLQDRKSPVYLGERIGRGGKPFQMVKIRSMIADADKTGKLSTASDDPRITLVGRIIRRFKLDEFPQLVNVLRGEMSLVGPRPEVQRECLLYTNEEKELWQVRPGITDISSIVFADQGDITMGHANTHLAYNQLIRPWKSRLALLYVKKRNIVLDVQLCCLTLYNFVSRPRALKALARVVENLTDDANLVAVVRRDFELAPTPPPGSVEIVSEAAIQKALRRI